MTEFGRYLRLIRRKLGLSQYEVARRSGLTLSTISRIEQGARSTSEASRERIEKALCRKVSYHSYKELLQCEQPLSSN